jgi:glycosyltransferase involved in cell wall biosynthesis
MALGRPCVATAVPGTRDVARDGVEALLVPAADARALAGALARLRDDAALRERLGRSARERVRDHLRIEDNVARLLALYGLVLSPGG